MLSIFLSFAVVHRPVELHWSAAPGCPTQAAVERELTERLAGTPPLDRPLAVDAEIRRSSGRYILDLHLHNEIYDQSVQYSRRTCDALGEMAVLYVTSAFPNLRPASEAKATPASAPLAKSKLPAKSARPRLGGSLRLGGVFGLMVGGFSPSTGPIGPIGGASLHIGLRGRRWRIEGGGHYVRSAALKDHVLQQQVPFRVRWQVVAGQVSACASALGRPVVELHLCGGGEVGALLGRSLDEVVQGKRATTWWLALHAGAMVMVRLHPRIYMWGSATPIVAFTDDVSVKVDANSEPVAYKTNRTWWQLRGALGIEVRWGS